VHDADSTLKLFKDADGKVTYQIVVTNDGNVDLLNPVVTDPTLAALGVAVQTGGAMGTDHHDNILEVGETWTYTVDAAWAAGSHTNKAEVAASYQDDAGHKWTTDQITHTDSATYFGLDPKLSITKVTSDGHYTGDSLVTFAGTAITWTYTVTNTSNDNGIKFSSVKVTDTNSAGDTVTPVFDAAHSTGYLDGMLDKGDSWVYVATGTAHLYQHRYGDGHDRGGRLRGDIDRDGLGWFRLHGRERGDDLYPGLLGLPHERLGRHSG